MKQLRWLISGGAIAGILIHLFLPDVKIDSITIALFIISLVPWLAPLFKSLPGKD